MSRLIPGPTPAHLCDPPEPDWPVDLSDPPPPGSLYQCDCSRWWVRRRSIVCGDYIWTPVRWWMLRARRMIRAEKVCVAIGPPPGPGLVPYVCSLPKHHNGAHQAHDLDGLADSWPIRGNRP